MTEPPWQGSALMRPGVLAFTGTIGVTDPHAHHAVQIMTAPTAMTIVDGNGAHHRGTTVIVPADAAHRIDTGAARGALVFLDPDSTAGRAAHYRSVHHGWTSGSVLSHTREPTLGAVVADLITQLGIAVKPDFPAGYLQQVTYPFTTAGGCTSTSEASPAVIRTR
ncbi:MAG: hypothetical protein ACREJT_04610 [Myxococcota bacterium]